MFERNPECIKVLGKDGSLLDINPAGLSFLEAESILEVRTHGLSNFVLPAYQSGFSELLLRAKAGASGVLEFEIRGLRGGHRWLETHVTPLSDGDGEVTMILTVTRDITAAKVDGAARQAAESALRISDVALESISQGVIIAAPDRRILSVNSAFSKITGYSGSEVVGRTCRFMQGLLTDPQTVVRIRERVQMFMEFSGEIVNYRKDGRPFWNELTISPVFDDAGVATHFIGITRDVTARKQADHALRESEAPLRLGARGGDLGVWDWNVPGGTLRVNERWLTMLGLEPHALTPSIDSWHALVHTEDMSKLSQNMEALRSPLENQIDVEVRAQHRQGHWIWIHVVGSVVERGPEGIFDPRCRHPYRHHGPQTRAGRTGSRRRGAGRKRSAGAHATAPDTRRGRGLLDYLRYRPMYRPCVRRLAAARRLCHRRTAWAAPRAATRR